MSSKFTDAMGRMFDWQATVELLQYDFVQQALLAGAILGLLAGIIGPLIVSRQMAFSVHGTSELSLTGAAAALLVGVSIGIGAVFGAVVAAILFGILGTRARERDSVIGVVMAFGLGLAVLLLWAYDGRTGAAFSLLTGQIVAPGGTGIALLAACAVGVIGTMLVIYRPLLFASTDPEVAVARGVPVRLLSPLFAVLIALVTALAVPIVGAILVLSVTIIPGAAAARVTASPLVATILAVVIAEVALVGGTILSLAPGLPISGYVATIAFLGYLACRVVGRARGQVRTG